MTHSLTSGVAGVVLLLASMTVPAPAKDVPVPVIISTDSATGLTGGWRSGVGDPDDGLAVAMALASPQLEVLGIVVTFGNTLMEPEFSVATRVVEGMGAQVPVRRGAARPMPDAPVRRYDGAAIDGACLNDGVRFMADQLRGSAAPVTILAMGPLTDVACLALNFPDLVSGIERIVLIGGRDPGQAFKINGRHLADFNLALDFPAISYLLEETTVPLRFMPFGLTSSVLVPVGERETLCKSNLRLASDFFCPSIVPWIEFWTKTFAEAGFHPWDQNTVYVTTAPQHFDCSPATYEIIDCAKGKCAGHDPANPARLALEGAQLWLTTDPAATRIEMCGSYAAGGKAAFEEAIFAFAR